MNTKRTLAKKAICNALLAIYGAAHLPLAYAAPTIIHTEPLASGGTSVPANLMFILDSSGSMGQNYTPDYVNNALCRDGDDDRNNDNCGTGDPVFAGPSFNTQYYNPSITYIPGYDLNYTAYTPNLTAPSATPAYLARSNMVNYNTPALWAAAQNDPFSSNTPSGTTNLVYGNTDVVYCNVSGPSTAQKFNTAVCKDPVDSSVTPAAEAAGTGVWRYPNPARNSSNGAFNFANGANRTGTSTNPVPPYFYSISQILFCVNRNGNTGGTRQATGFAGSKSYFGKGAVGDATNKCNTRRFNDLTNNFQWPRFGLIPYSSATDTQLLNEQETGGAGTAATDNAAGRWEGMSGFRRHDIVETSAGSDTLPAAYPSRASAAVYTNRDDCSFKPCTYTMEMTNYANWFVYYSTRIKMMKSAAGLAFFNMDDKFRVGFITINPGNPVPASKYLALDTFNTTQKANWYAKFYSQTVANSTPLREALSRVGRHFAGKTDQINTGMGFSPTSLNPQGNPDSMIASCQKNFALLTTDGYWNGSGGVQMDGTTAMDSQDSSEPRPYFDGPSAPSNTLADVAMYYYKNDLRPAVMIGSPAQDIWENNVAATGQDTAPHQHMTTFTLGLGLDGILDYQTNYDSTPPPPGDFANIVSGAKNWPVPVADTESALDDLWHAAVNGRGKFFSARDPAALASGLSEALAHLQTATGAGAAAATSNLQPVAGDNWAFTAQYQTVSWNGDVKARTIDLVGGIISPVGLWSASDKLDTKCTLASCASTATRSLYTFTSDTTNFPNKVKALSWSNGAGTTYPTDTNLTTAEQAFFNPTLIGGSNSWNGSQTAAATAKNVVDFTRGDRTLENTGNNFDTDLFRTRLHVLGDVVSAQPVYIKAPPFFYTDNGYAAFQTAQLGRRGTLSVAANDGMLHAVETDPDGSPYYQINGITSPIDRTGDTFSTGTNDGGGERWSFIPSRVMSNLYTLATFNYQHRWYVDGTPIVEDYCVTSATGSGSTTSPAYTCPGTASWKTVLVGGLNGGGRGYYALDVTDPLNPKGLWEFNARDPSVTACAATTAFAIGASSDCDLGLSFGNPIITKLPLGHAQSGKWVVLVTSGYDNYKTVDGAAANTAGDGNGYLYVLDVLTGTIIEKIQTCTGSPGTAGATPPYSDASPCGFTKINTYHPSQDDHVDNSPIRVYGTTVRGEIWRVDLTQQLTPRVYLVATLKDPSGTVQPITTPPELFMPSSLEALGYAGPWNAPAAVYVGTGRYLGLPDRTDLQRQSLYAIRDIPGTTTTLANARSSLQSRGFTSETTVSGVTKRNMTGGSTDAFTASNGWYVDFPLDASSQPTGERATVDFRIVATTLVIASNIPAVNSCVAGGSSWLNTIDVNTGSAVTGLTTPYTSIKLPASLAVGISPIQLGDKIKTIVTTADNQQLTFDTPISGSDFQGQRVQWRELTQ